MEAKTRIKVVMKYTNILTMKKSLKGIRKLNLPVANILLIVLDIVQALMLKGNENLIKIISINILSITDIPTTKISSKEKEKKKGNSPQSLNPSASFFCLAFNQTGQGHLIRHP